MGMNITLDLVPVTRGITLTELSSRTGLSITNLSLLKTGRVQGIRFSTLNAICHALECRPGDLLACEPASDKTAKDKNLTDNRNPDQQKGGRS